MTMKSLLSDLAVFVAAFIVVTVLIGILHGVGVDVPTLPDWITGV